MPTLYINGEVRQWVVGSLNLDYALGERGVLSFTMFDPDGTINPQKGHQVHFYAPNYSGTDVLQFGGLIETVTEQAATVRADNGLFYAITCVDWASFADRRSVAGVFENDTTGNIALEIVRQYLDQENIYAHRYPGRLVTEARTDLYGFWRLAEDADDDSWWSTTAATTDGTETGSPTYSGRGTGSPVGDTHLGGYVTTSSGNYVVTGRGANALTFHDPAATDGFTAMIWLREDGTDTGAMGAFCCGNDAATTGDNLFQMRRNSDADGGHMEGVLKSASGSTITVEDTGFSLVADTWYQYVLVADNINETAYLYRNGVEVDSQAVSGGFKIDVTSGNPNLVIGALTEAGDNAWEGRLSEAAYFRRPLSATDISGIYGEAGESLYTSSGLTITKFVADYTPALQALEDLSNYLAYEMKIDQYRTLHFHERGADCCIAPFNVTNSTMIGSGVMREIDDSKYRNYQVLKGAKDKTAEQVEVITVSDADQSVVVGYNLAEEPTIEVDTGGGYSAATVDIKGATGSDFYWEKGSPAIDVDDTFGLAVNDKVRVTYFGEFAVVIVSTDQSEIIRQQNVEKSGSGTIENVISDNLVDTREQGFEQAAAQLERYALSGSSFKFRTRFAGLMPGHLIELTVPVHGYSSAEGIVEQVGIFDQGGIELQYNVSVATGAVKRSWEAMFVAPLQQIDAANQNENITTEQITTIQVNGETVTITVTELSTETAVTCATLAATMPFTLC